MRPMSTPMTSSAIWAQGSQGEISLVNLKRDLIWEKNPGRFSGADVRFAMCIRIPTPGGAHGVVRVRRIPGAHLSLHRSPKPSDASTSRLPSTLDPCDALTWGDGRHRSATTRDD